MNRFYVIYSNRIGYNDEVHELYRNNCSETEAIEAMITAGEDNLPGIYCIFDSKEYPTLDEAILNIQEGTRAAQKEWEAQLETELSHSKK
jgi:hypothetical protein